ncbi:MAG: hypothetical protein JWR03_2948 [Cohnella sp.]|nr:hypothetical protein [Cohnella sp.]
MAEDDSKDKATKAEVQTTELNKMPVPELEESATEEVYGSKKDLAEHSLFNKEEQS